MTEDETPQDPPLPARSSAGEIIGGFLAGLDGFLMSRPRPVPQIEEQYTDPWDSADGVTVDGLDEPVDRPERPDRSGARL